MEDASRSAAGRSVGSEGTHAQRHEAERETAETVRHEPGELGARQRVAAHGGAHDLVEPVHGRQGAYREAGPSRVVAEQAVSVGGVKAMPAVRALAKKLGVDLSRVAASGAGGVVTMNDVKDAASKGTAKAGAAPAAATAPAPAPVAAAPTAAPQRTAVSASGQPMRTARRL